MKTSNILLWLDAARPKTLAAAISPVSLGAVLAFKDGLFRWDTTTVALFCALLIQVGTNFANDYFDHQKGADTEKRIGFKRATASGLIRPKQMFIAFALALGIAFLAGLYLVYVSGWQIFVIGLLSLLFGVLYTGGPFPLAYNGLGDIFVFLFFGFAAVMGTYYVNAGFWGESSFWAAIALGALSTNILVINNLRDTEEDALSNKQTLGVIFGDTFLKWEYMLMLALAYSIPPHFFAQLSYSAWIFLPFATAPFAFYLGKKLWTLRDKKVLNKHLAKTAQFMVLFTLLFCIGVLL